MIPKLWAYGFSQDVLQYIRNYLTNTQQIVQAKSNFSHWGNIIDKVPHCSILEPFFNLKFAFKYLCRLQDFISLWL